jgi:hypothetical protein
MSAKSSRWEEAMPSGSNTGSATNPMSMATRSNSRPASVAATVQRWPPPGRSSSTCDRSTANSKRSSSITAAASKSNPTAVLTDCPIDVDVLGGAGLRAEPQLEREPSLEHPGVRRHGMQAREQTLEYHALA